MKTSSKWCISIFILFLLAAGCVCLWFFLPKTNDNEAKADEIINRTDEDLVQINLKIKELENNVIIVQENQGEYTMKIEQFQTELAQYNNAIEAIKAQQDETSDKFQTQLSVLISERDAVQTKILAAQGEIASLQTRATDIEQQITTLQGYAELILDLQNEVIAIKELQETMSGALNGFLTRLERLETAVDTLTIAQQTTNTQLFSSTDLSSVIDSGTIICKRYGNTVTLFINHIRLKSALDKFNEVTLMMLPTEYRPSAPVNHSFASMTTGSHFIRIDTDGKMIIAAWSQATIYDEYIALCLTYVV